MDWPRRVTEFQPPSINVGEHWLEKTGIPPLLTTATWALADQMISMPVRVRRKMTVKKLYAFNGAVVSGNCDIGLYSFDQTGRTASWPNMTLLASSGATAQAGTNQWQAFDIADIVLGPSIYYLAYSLNNTTGQVMRLVSVVQLNANGYRVGGLLQHGSTPAFPLPATTLGLQPNGSQTYQYPMLALGGIA